MAERTEGTTHSRILEFVERHPGVSAREIQRSLSLGWGDTAFHLDRMLERSTLVRERSARRDYYFPKGSTSLDRNILIAFQITSEREILLALSLRPGQSFSQLLTALRASRSNLSLHLHFLIRLNMVTFSLDCGTRRYMVTEPTRVLELYRRYKPIGGRKWVDRFVESFGPLLPP